MKRSSHDVATKLPDEAFTRVIRYVTQFTVRLRQNHQSPLLNAGLDSSVPVTGDMEDKTTEKMDEIPEFTNGTRSRHVAQCVRLE